MSADRAADRAYLLAAPRCDHGLVACRPCRTATPGQNRHWQQHGGPAPARETSGRPPVLGVLRNRGDRRASGQHATAGRGRRRRQAFAS